MTNGLNGKNYILQYGKNKIYKPERWIWSIHVEFILIIKQNLSVGHEQ